MSEMILFTGNAHPALAESVASHLNIKLGDAIVSRFSDGEIMVEIKENVRGHDAFILQPTCSPSNDTLMELIIMADAIRRSSAARITAVIPYFGYARQDRRVRSARVPISAKVVADMIATAGISRVLTIDLHADQIQGFFNIPVDNIYATPVIMHDIEKSSKSFDKLMVVSPDVGGVVRARAIAKRCKNSDLAIIDKRRSGPNHSQVMHIIGDVKGQDCLIVDDIVDTAGTLCSGAQALKDAGANSVSAYITHPVLSGPAVQNINRSTLDEVVVTNTIPLNEMSRNSAKIRSIDLSGLLATTIKRIHEEESISSLFEGF